MNTNRKIMTLAFCLAVFVEAVAFAGNESNKLSAVRLTPSEITWPSSSTHSTNLQTVVLAGDPGKAGLYTIRIIIPANLKILPHWHPEARMVTVTSGIMYIGYGERFDETQLKELPAGSFFTEPAGMPHFAWAKSGEVIVQATGTGPTGTTQIKPADQKP